MELAHAKHIIRRSSVGLGVFLLILLVIKNFILPYDSLQQNTVVWFDILIMFLIVVGGAIAATSIYKLAKTTIDSLYAGVKTGYGAGVIIAVAYGLVGILASTWLSQKPEASGIVFVGGNSVLLNRVLFNLFSTVGILCWSILLGLFGGLVGWITGVVMVHGVIQHADNDVSQHHEDTHLVPEETNLVPLEETSQLVTDATLEAPQDIEILLEQEPTSAASSQVVQTTPITPPTLIEQEPVVTIADEDTIAIHHATPLHIVSLTNSDIQTPLNHLGGITDSHIRALESIGIRDVETLLARGQGAANRTDLVNQTGISPEDLLAYVNMADLMRVPGISGNLAKLFEVAGIDTVIELGKRNATNLHPRLTEANSIVNLVDLTPTLDQVRGLIAAAKTLDRAVNH